MRCCDKHVVGTKRIKELNGSNLRIKRLMRWIVSFVMVAHEFKQFLVVTVSLGWCIKIIGKDWLLLLLSPSTSLADCFHSLPSSTLPWSATLPRSAIANSLQFQGVLLLLSDSPLFRCVNRFRWWKGSCHGGCVFDSGKTAIWCSVVLKV